MLHIGKKIKNYLSNLLWFQSETKILLQNFLLEQTLEKISENKNGEYINRFGVFSQSDEDGIIESIFDDIGVQSKKFVEIGIGNGLENNTHYLLLKGWKGLWIDSSEKQIDYINKNMDQNSNVLVIKKQFITPDNVVDVVKSSSSVLGEQINIDFLSVDIDSFDYEVVGALVELSPRVLCVEYNPALRTKLDLYVSYKNKNGWDKSIYHGASLQALHKLLSHSYALIGCSISGYNAFFVKKDCLNKLEALSVDQAFQPSRIYLTRMQNGHRKSFGWVNDILSLKN